MRKKVVRYRKLKKQLYFQQGKDVKNEIYRSGQ